MARSKPQSKTKPRRKPASTTRARATKKPQVTKKLPPPEKRNVLAIDVGGTKVKMLVNGELEPRKALTGPEFTPVRLLEVVNELTADWKFDAVSIGYPGLVGPNGPMSEPGNLGSGWVGFDFDSAFGKPVKLVNDAAMQAIGSYEGGRMLFLGLGTGLGSTLMVEKAIVPLELSVLRWNSQATIGEMVSKSSIKAIGLKKWRSIVGEVVHRLMSAFLADYVIIGGGNAKLLKQIPPGARLGHNQTAFRGGFRLWGLYDVLDDHPVNFDPEIDWRVI